MEKKLNSIIELIDNHFKNIVWNMQPPLLEVDYQLLVLAQKIITIRSSIDNLSTNKIDSEISNIMEFMEQTFKIPLLDENLQTWLKQFEVRGRLIINVYKKLSNLRSL